MQRRTWRLATALLAAVFSFGVGLCWAQDAGVSAPPPTINKPFVNPDVEKFVKRFERPGREVFDKRHEIVEACGVRPGMVVADVGAGTGLFTRLFAKAVGPKGRVYAVDISKKFVDYVVRTAREQGLKNVVGIVNTPTSTLLPEKAVDLVFICDTYHHFEHPAETLASIYKALKPGGQLVLIDFERKKNAKGNWVKKHVRAGKETFKKEIEQAGFEFVEEVPILKSNYFLRFVKRALGSAVRHTEDSLETVRQRLQSGEAVLVDVREPSEWEAGHLAEARLLPLSELQKLAESPDAAKKLSAKLPKDKVVYLHCRSGRRVLKAAKILSKFGYDVRPLRQGYKQLLEAGFRRAE